MFPGGRYRTSRSALSESIATDFFVSVVSHEESPLSSLLCFYPTSLQSCQTAHMGLSHQNCPRKSLLHHQAPYRLGSREEFPQLSRRFPVRKRRWHFSMKGHPFVAALSAGIANQLGAPNHHSQLKFWRADTLKFLPSTGYLQNIIKDVWCMKLYVGILFSSCFAFLEAVQAQKNRQGGNKWQSIRVIPTALWIPAYAVKILPCSQANRHPQEDPLALWGILR